MSAGPYVLAVLLPERCALLSRSHHKPGFSPAVTDMLPNSIMSGLSHCHLSSQHTQSSASFACLAAVAHLTFDSAASACNGHALARQPLCHTVQTYGSCISLFSAQRGMFNGAQAHLASGAAGGAGS